MSTRLRSLVLAVAVSAATTSSLSQGMVTMSTPPRSDLLLWQGAADRKPRQFVSVQVVTISKFSSGLFGIGNSQSIAGAMSDPRLIEGRAIGADGVGVRAKVPGGQLPGGLRKGSRLVLGLVDDQHVICLLLPPDTVADAALADWASTQACG